MIRVGIKSALKKIPAIHALGKGVKNRVADLRAIPDFLAERKLCREEGPIRVGFFCQYIPAWTKVAPIYEQMKKDPRFEPFLLCLPSGIMDGRLTVPESLENDTYRYCLEHGYREAINTLTGKEQWLDLKSMGLHYVFYPRPYNALVPLCYQAQVVRRYSRICILMYGIATTEDITRITLNRDFMHSAYYYFAEAPFAERINRRNNWLLHGLKLQKTVLRGVPVLEQLADTRNTPSPSWEFSKNPFRVMWTPRWTTEKSEGGSNFFTYWKALPDYAENRPDTDFLFRPHPLAFSHFVQTGEMTEQDVSDFQARCQALPNVQLDKESQYEATLWGSSVLVSDISGIMPEYFTTGKPLIFCASNMELKLADFAQRMIYEGCYVVNDARELFACLDRLRRGEDPLRETRQVLIAELFGQSSANATQNIIEELAADRLK